MVDDASVADETAFPLLLVEFELLIMGRTQQPDRLRLRELTIAEFSLDLFRVIRIWHSQNVSQ
jgi:hypothetical protein